MKTREEIKQDMKEVILAHLKEKGIDPTDSTTVIMNAPGIWRALVVSGKMPRQLTYDMMMSSMIERSMNRWFKGKFGG